MKAVILAAGKGVRMRPLTDTTPKPLLSVSGRPIIEHIIRELPSEVDELVIVVGYLREQIRQFLGEEFLGRRVSYVAQEEQLGTYHALALTKPYIKEGERFFMLAADDIIGGGGLKDCLLYPRAMLVAEVEDPRRFGVVTVNPDGTVADILEKPEHPVSNLVSPSAFLFDHHIFEFAPDPDPKHKEYFIPSAIVKMIKRYPMQAVRSTLWISTACPEDLVIAEAKLKERALSETRARM